MHNQKQQKQNVAKVFGLRLRALRKTKGMTQEALGKKAKVDYKHLGAIERGAKTPSFDSVGRLADALGVQVFEMFVPPDADAVSLAAEIKRLAKDRELQATSPAAIKRLVVDLRTALRRFSERG